MTETDIVAGGNYRYGYADCCERLRDLIKELESKGISVPSEIKKFCGWDKT